MLAVAEQRNTPTAAEMAGTSVSSAEGAEPSFNPSIQAVNWANIVGVVDTITEGFPVDDGEAERALVGLADNLGVQRKASRVAVDLLRAAGTVDVQRARVDILDRARLEAQVCECYDATRSVRDHRQTPA